MPCDAMLHCPMRMGDVSTGVCEGPNVRCVCTKTLVLVARGITPGCCLNVAEPIKGAPYISISTHPAFPIRWSKNFLSTFSHTKGSKAGKCHHFVYFHSQIREFYSQKNQHLQVSLPTLYPICVRISPPPPASQPVTSTRPNQPLPPKPQPEPQFPPTKPLC